MKQKVKALDKVGLCGSEIRGERTVYYACQSVFGIGPARAQAICDWLKENYQIDATVPIGSLSNEIIQFLNNFIPENWKVEADLRKHQGENIERKKKIQSREGKRLTLHLPLKGRTRSNARTAKQKRK